MEEEDKVDYDLKEERGGEVKKRRRKWKEKQTLSNNTRLQVS